MMRGRRRWWGLRTKDWGEGKSWKMIEEEEEEKIMGKKKIRKKENVRETKMEKERR